MIERKRNNYIPQHWIKKGNCSFYVLTDELFFCGIVPRFQYLLLVSKRNMILEKFDLPPYNVDSTDHSFSDFGEWLPR